MGEVLGALLQPGDVVALFGELGSGKTVLVRGLAAGLGCVPGDVHSPSFTLINEYACLPSPLSAVPGQAGGDRQACPPRAGAAVRGGREWCLAHVDLYRVHSEEELPGIGWDEYVRFPYVMAVEWAERALAWLPRDHLRVRLETTGSQRRRLRVQATGPRSARLARGWLEAVGVGAQVS